MSTLTPAILSIPFLRPFAASHAKYICSPTKTLRISMSTPNSDQQDEETSQSSENIEIPPIPKQTAGAVAGAAVGSIAGPIGAIVGGVAGALAGKAAKGRRVRSASARSLRKVVRSATTRPKRAAKGLLAKKSGSASRKGATRSRSKVKRSPSKRTTLSKSRKTARTRRASSSSRAPRNRGGSRKKRH